MGWKHADQITNNEVCPVVDATVMQSMPPCFEEEEEEDQAEEGEGKGEWEGAEQKLEKNTQGNIIPT